MGKGMFSFMAWTFPFLDIRIITGTVCWHRQANKNKKRGIQNLEYQGKRILEVIV